MGTKCAVCSYIKHFSFSNIFLTKVFCLTVELQFNYKNYGRGKGSSFHLKYFVGHLSFIWQHIFSTATVMILPNQHLLI